MRDRGTAYCHHFTDEKTGVRKVKDFESLTANQQAVCAPGSDRRPLSVKLITERGRRSCCPVTFSLFGEILSALSDVPWFVSTSQYSMYYLSWTPQSYSNPFYLILI